MFRSTGTSDEEAEVRLRRQKEACARARESHVGLFLVDVQSDFDVLMSWNRFIAFAGRDDRALPG